MIPLKLSLQAGKKLEILCLGAHSDDIEIGCGGTILRLLKEYPESRVHWVVFSASGVRKAEAKRGAQAFVGKAQLKKLMLKSFRDGFMPFNGAAIKDVFESLKDISPDLIFTHNRKDAHQDHRLIAECAWNTFRNHLILEYEIPKYDGDLGQPNFFVMLKDEVRARKTRMIMEVFQSQRAKHWFSEDTFNALMRIRGMECAAPDGFAEAFYCRKLSY